MGFRMYVPTRIIFGAGSLNKLSRQKLPGKKALVVISNGKSTRANGYLDRTLEALQQAGAETVVFDQVMANPLKSWQAALLRGNRAVISSLHWAAAV